MKFKVYTDKKADAPKVTTVVANSAQAAILAVEIEWEGCKVTRVVAVEN